ncbi:MAG: helix-turn-helix transcriptional regulator [Phascolarctobacterium sp.]|nr:helix-turn-helix transcriptional regulator [Phascolarctobacterium sp.]MBR6636908.1 helix-turn-helix transcriptional regulator [Phascolarctobacterium sp.]
MAKSRLAMCREKSGLTQRSMAEKLKISVSAYNDYENGKKTCTKKVAEDISKILKIDLHQIFLPARFTVSKSKGV